jgi:hypothetical protein
MKPESTGPAKRRRSENWPPGTIGQRLAVSAIRTTDYSGSGTFAVWDHSGNFCSDRFAAIASCFFTDPSSKVRFMKAFFLGKRTQWDSIGPHEA